MRVPMRRLLPNNPDPTRPRVARSLPAVLIAVGVSLSTCAGVLGALALSTPLQLARDLDRLDDAAARVLDVERFASLAYDLLVEDLIALESGASLARTAKRAELRARAQAMLVAEERPGRAIDEVTRNSWLELMEALDRERAGVRRVSTGSPDASKVDARRERLELLAVARLGERLTRLHREELSGLEYLASRVSLAGDYPLLRYLGGEAMRKQGITSLFTAIAAERVAGTFRYQRWQRASGRPVEPALLEMRAREVERLATQAQTDGRRPVVELAAALGHPRKTARNSLERLEVGGVELFEHESERAFERFRARASSLALAVGALSIVLGVLAASSLIVALLLPALVRRWIGEPLTLLPDLVHDAETPIPASARTWIELEAIRETARLHAERTRETERRSIELAFYDSTTGVANRRFFAERLSSAVVAAKRDHRQLALLSMSLEELASGSELLSRTDADTVLRQAANRLHELVRLSDLVGNQDASNPQTGISRTAEAEFALLVSNVRDPQDAARVAERALESFARPFVVEGQSISLQCNFGVAIYPTDAASAEELLRNAQIALRHAQQRGANQYQFFSSHLNDVAARRFHVRNRLGVALERGDLSILFQPIRDTRSGRTTCAEVLMRWSDDEMGPVPPSEFIAVAEQTGLVGPLGRWALEQACLQQRAWIDAGYEPIRVAVNVSPLQFAENEWPDVVQQTIERTGMNPEHLDLEITETALLRESPATLATFERMVELGVGLVVDDFGTGFASLSYLHHYPIDRIKIDRSFVSDLGTERKGAGISNAILAMAESLDLGVIAEGVETEEQARRLIERGCREIQGYLISQAISAHDFVSFLEAREKDEA